MTTGPSARVSDPRKLADADLDHVLKAGSRGFQHAGEAGGLLNRANALIDDTGAKAYEALMLRMRARASEEKNLAPPRRS